MLLQRRRAATAKNEVESVSDMHETAETEEVVVVMT
ncbi:hypothetical protein PI125_g3175 [Phytophthora idaei]|nr:hypothetical protein PI125_g3175 [Phytophthora idaei]KAG3171526.1 hypothetical protein PI126_g1818 [Phytophthora idaei]